MAWLEIAFELPLAARDEVDREVNHSDAGLTKINSCESRIPSFSHYVLSMPLPKVYMEGYGVNVRTTEQFERAASLVKCSSWRPPSEIEVDPVSQAQALSFGAACLDDIRNFHRLTCSRWPSWLRPSATI